MSTIQNVRNGKTGFYFPYGFELELIHYVAPCIMYRLMAFVFTEYPARPLFLADGGGSGLVLWVYGRPLFCPFRPARCLPIAR